MMDSLIDLSDRLRLDLSNWLSNVLPASSVRGTLLDIDEYWHEAAKLDAMNKVAWYALELHQLTDQLWQEHRSIYGWKLDPSWRPHGWSEHCKTMSYPTNAEPFVIRVILRDPKYVPSGGLPTHFRTYPIIYEFRPPCRALSTISGMAGSVREIGRWLTRKTYGKPVSVGCEVTRDKPWRTSGTLGGVLWCPETLKYYLVSCAHVLYQPETTVLSPGPFEHKPSREIGKVKISAFPEPKLAGQNCSVQVQSNAAKVDAAIAEMWGGRDMLQHLNIASIHHMRKVSEMDKNDRVFFVGKESGRVEARIGALTIWDDVLLPDGAYEGGSRCFGQLFEIKPVERQYVRKEIARAGDSGSWIVSEFGNELCWDGMLICSDGPQGYACFAENIMEESYRSAQTGRLSLIT